MKIIFLGNSYIHTNVLPDVFRQLADANGAECEQYMVTSGGRYLDMNVEQDDETTQKLNALLEADTYDVVVLQEQSTAAVRVPERFHRGMLLAGEKVKPKTKRIVLYETWARKAGSPELDELQRDPASMLSGLQTAYRKAADALGAEIAHVGTNFSKIIAAYPSLELYRSDMSHPSQLGTDVAALTIYKQIYGVFPADLSPLAITDWEKEALRRVINQ